MRSQIDMVKLYKETIFSELDNLNGKVSDSKLKVKNQLDLKLKDEPRNNKQSIFLKKLIKIDNSEITDKIELNKKHSKITNSSSKSIQEKENKTNKFDSTKIDFKSDLTNLNLNLIEHYYSSSEN